MQSKKPNAFKGFLVENPHLSLDLLVSSLDNKVSEPLKGIPMDSSQYASFDEYFDTFPAHTRSILQNIRELIAATAPDAVEVFSYGMPTFKLNKKVLVHFAGYAGHIGLYATPSGNEAFQEKLRAYKTGKGSIQLPNTEPFPYDLVRDIVSFRLKELTRGANIQE